MERIPRPPVTVAMIVYNQERYVAEAVESMLHQTFPDFELVVIDDGSTDRTGEIVRGFHDARVRYMRQSNQGPSAARNTALREARGEIIAQMSGDDVSEPDRLARQLEHLAGRKDCVVFTRTVVIDDNGQPHPGDFFGPVRGMEDRPREEILHHLFTMGNCLVAPTAMGARALFEAGGGYDLLLFQTQDMEMWTRLLLRGVSLETVSDPLFRYRVRAAHGNLSAPTGATHVRTFFERKRLLHAYRALATVSALSAVFPEIATLGYPLDESLTPFYLALVAIHNTGTNRVTPFFGGDLLYDLMADEPFRVRLQNRVGFGLPELFRLVGAMDPFAGYRHETEWRPTVRSRRLPNPLRALSGLLRRGR